MAPVVTVFGGSGFLGRHTVRALARAGFRVRVAVRKPNLATFLMVAGQVGQIETRRTNIRNPADVAAALKGADAAINLVGVLSQSGHQSFEELHVGAAETIARTAAEHGVRRLIHVSAIGADPESDAAYAASKGKGEAGVKAAFPGATILRPSIVFGPEDDFFNRFAALARMSPVLPLIGGGKTRFQPVFVGDVASAIQACLENAGTQGQTYELGGPDSYSFKALMQLILRVTCRKRLLLPLPFGLAGFKALFLQFMPGALKLTPDQVRMLKTDNVVSAGAKTLADLGIVPDSVEAIVPTYLWRFRPHGQYEPGSEERFTPLAGRQ